MISLVEFIPDVVDDGLHDLPVYDLHGRDVGRNDLGEDLTGSVSVPCVTRLEGEYHNVLDGPALEASRLNQQ